MTSDLTEGIKRVLTWSKLVWDIERLQQKSRRYERGFICLVDRLRLEKGVGGVGETVWLSELSETVWISELGEIVWLSELGEIGLSEVDTIGDGRPIGIDESEATNSDTWGWFWK